MWNAREKEKERASMCIEERMFVRVGKIDR